MSRIPAFLITLSFLAACDPKEDDTGPATTVVDDDGDGFAAADDCDDGDPNINSGATESCDGVDNNCDGVIDEGVESTFFADTDEDGFGDAATTMEACEVYPGFVPNDTDCDDTDSAINPGVAEICDGLDNNCDGTADEDSAVDATTWYADTDADGYGVEADTLVQCEGPQGYVDISGDCDDTDVRFNPGAEEDDCTDPADYNCDGSVGYADDDGDGWAACAECDDNDTFVNPDADEVCDNIDNDCDGETDEDDAVNASTWYRDGDEDGYGDPDNSTSSCREPSGYTEDATDCNDRDEDQFPGADEYCNDEDDDCDGTIDEDDALDANDWYEDIDGDGFGNPDVSATACDLPAGYAEDDTDCDDTDADVNDDAEEVCDEVDNDCDGETDEDSATDAETWYADSDEDGYGDIDVTTVSCDQPSGYTTDTTDCDDDNNEISPDADEVCDEIDNDCDGSTDEDDATDAPTWYADRDGDTYGDSARTDAACEAPTGFVSDDSDCDDTDSAISPAASEVCDEVDNDCDGDIDDDDDNLDESTGTVWYSDVDGDGYGSETFTLQQCAQPSNYVTDNTDCDDDDSSIYPGASGEVYHDDIDQDCDDFDGYTIDDLVEGDLIITEIMPNPAAVNDSKGEYFEFYNASGLQVDLNGLRFSDNASSSTLSDRLVAEDGDYIVFAIDDDTTLNGGVDADFDWSGPALSNAGDEVVLSYGSVVFDEVDYSSFTVNAGISMNLDPSADHLDNDDEAFWCEATSTYGDGDYGTPGLENDECTSVLYNIGNDTEFSSASSHSPNYLLGSPITVSADATLDTFSVIIKSGSANVTMALYSDSSGSPDALVAYGSTSYSGAGIVEIDVTDVSLTAGDYWLMGVFDVSASVGINYSGTVKYKSFAYSGTLPDPFGSVTTYSGQEFNYYITVY